MQSSLLHCLPRPVSSNHIHQQQVSNVVEILDMGEDSDDEENEATNAKAKSVARSHGKSCVVRTSTRQTIFLPVPGLVDVTKVRVAIAPGGCSAIVLFLPREML